MTPSLLLQAAVAVAALSLVVSRTTSRTSTESAGMHVALQLTEDPNIRCANNRTTSIAIPFERLDLGRVERVTPSEGYVLLRGSRMLAVVSDSTQWPAVWHAAVDSVKALPVAFGKDVLVLVATRPSPMGDASLSVTSIRQCRRSGVVVVSTLETHPNVVSTGMWSRGFDLVRAPGRTLGENIVLFDEHLRFVP